MERTVSISEVRQSFEELAANPPFRFSFAIERISEYFRDRRDLEILDIGSGSGLLPYLLQLRGYVVSIVEPEKSNLDKNLDLKKFHYFETLDDVQGKFDVITCLQVLEHLREDPFQFVQKFRYHLKENSLVIITTPIENHLDDFDHKYRFNFYDMMDFAEALQPSDYHIYFINKMWRFAKELNCFGLVIEI